MYEQYLPDIDVADGLKRIMNNKKVYFSLLQRFKVREMADDIAVNITGGDPVKIAQAAHALKGAASNLGMIPLFEAARDIEIQAKKEAGCTPLLPRLWETVDAAEQALGKLLLDENK